MLVKFIPILLVLGILAQVQCFSGRIVNGQEATEIVPYHAQLGIRLGNEPERSGSGIIVTTRLVLTAATNIFGFDTFRAGYGDIERGRLVWAEGIIGQTSPQFNPYTFENNIGFIIFATNAFTNNYVVPISIPPPHFEQNLPLENEQGKVVGFGWTTNDGPLAETLKVAFNRVVSSTECYSFYPEVDQNSNFCTLDEISNSKICAGDQGTAFVTNINGIPYLTGIASYMYEHQCIEGVPALFVRTLAYRIYIDGMTALWQ